MHHLAKSAPIRINAESGEYLLLHPLVLQRILLLVMLRWGFFLWR